MKPGNKDDADLDEFVAWLKAAAQPLQTSVPGVAVDDLAVLSEIAGGARVVGIGENFHGIREFLGLRQRATRYLIECEGFEAVVLESGLPEGRLVHDYVLGCDRPRNLWEDGFTWTFGDFAGTRELVEWIRDHNRRSARKVRFYGVDVAGAKGSWRGAAEQVLAYLDKVEPEWAADMRVRLLPLIARFERPGHSALDFTAANDAFAALPLPERTAVAAYVNELFDRFENLRLFYLRNSTCEDYDWARQIALNLRAASNMLTCYEAKDRPHPVWNARNLAMAANVEWVLRRSGPAGRVVFLAANNHVQRAASPEVEPYRASDGMFLAHSLGDDYRTVGFTYGEGSMPGIPGTNGPVPLQAAESDSLDGALARVGLPLFIVNLRTLPRDGVAANWLKRLRRQRGMDTYASYDQLQSWDGLIHIERISPSVQSYRL